MNWSNRFIGMPWVRHGRDRDGVDCWGLVYLVYGEVLGIDLPDYLTVPFDTGEMAVQVDAIAAADPWRTVCAPREFDVAVFRMGSLLRHVGIVSGDGTMLHVADGGLSCISPIDAPRWRSRLIGYCRHAEIEGRSGHGNN